MKTLLIVRLGGAKYGIWDEDVRSIEEARTIHHLPLSPDCISGMAIIDDSTVTLADLSVCMGHPPLAHEPPEHILLASEGAKAVGFVLTGEIERVPISTDAVFPLPESLSTREVDTCVVHESAPIPVINISELHHRIDQAGHASPGVQPAVPRVPQRDVSSITRVQGFECGGELLCAPSDDIEDISDRPERISRLGGVPPDVEGIAFHRGSILPVVHLAKRMNLPREGSASRMLVAALPGARFGCLVDADAGALSGDDFSINPLPPLVASDWMRAAVVHAGEIIPLVDVAALLSWRGAAGGGNPPAERYLPRSRFFPSFGKEEVEVVEFLLLGSRHALPGQEVAGTARFTPYRRMPNLQPIVVGVAEHEGELLPVIDLAMCFGRRSMATPEWRMILVRNGDFRALVVTEAVYGERRLPVAMQRALPIAVPHEIVYGCYPDASTVRLILNVEALTVHYDKKQVRDVITTVLKEVEQSPQGLAPSLVEPVEALESGASRESEGFVEPPGAEARIDPRDSIDSEDSLRSSASVEPEKLEVTEETGAGDVGGVTAGGKESDGAAAQAPEPVTAFLPEPGPPPRDQSEPGPALGAGWPSEAQPAECERPAAAAVTPEPETGRTVACQETRVVESGGAVEVGGFVATGEPRESAGVVGPREAEAAPAVPARETDPGEAPRGEQASDQVEEVGLAAGGPGEGEGKGIGPKEKMWLQDARETVIAGPDFRAIPEHRVRRESGARIAAPAEFGHVSAEAPPANTRRTRLLIAGLAAALIAVLYAVNGFMRAGVDNAGKVEQAETAVKAGSARGPEPVARTSASGKSSGSAPPRAPRGGSLDPGMYKVKRGDTLWMIAKRLTGNPLDYHRLASENEIANPDMIFPGQKLLVKKAE